MARKRSNGEGSIVPRKLKNGQVVYDAWISVTDPVTGRSQRLSKRGHKTHAEAVEWIQQQRIASTRPMSNGMTVEDLAGLYWQSGAVEKTTMYRWQKRWDVEIGPYLGQISLRELLPLHIDAWVAKIRSKESRGKVRKPTSLLNYVTILSAVLEYGVKNRLIDADWTKASAGVQKLRQDAARTEPEKKSPWTLEDFKRFLSIETEPSYRAMWMLMAATGVRRGNACGLKWSEVDFDEMVIRFQTNRVAVDDGVMETVAKAGRRIIVPMDELLAEVLRQQKARQEAEGIDSEYVFDRPLLYKTYKGRKLVKGQPMDPNGVTARFRRNRNRAGLKDGSPHTLRHLWATLAREMGASRDDVADVLGNTSKVVQAVYDHSETSRREVAKSMAKKVLG